MRQTISELCVEPSVQSENHPNRDGLLGSAEDDQKVDEEDDVVDGPENEGTPHVTAV